MKRIIFLSFIFCLLSIPVYAAEIVRFVDTGSDAGGDGTTSATSSGDNSHAYQSLNQWESNEQADLDTANNTHTVHTNRTNGGGKDQLLCKISGWTTSATDFITITQDDFPTDGIYDDTKYVIENNDDQAAAIQIREDYVRIVEMQVLVTTTSGTHQGIMTDVTAVANDIRYDKIIAKCVCSGTGTAHGLGMLGVNTLGTITNSVVYGFISGSDSNFRGIQGQANTLNAYNNTVRNNFFGITRSSGTLNSTNNALFDNGNDFVGTQTLLTNASDEGAGEGTSGVDISGGGGSDGDWQTTEFTDETIDDYHVQDTAAAIHDTGTDLSGTFTDDIVGVTRSTWDIGAYEFIVAAADIEDLGNVIIIEW